MRIRGERNEKEEKKRERRGARCWVGVAVAESIYYKFSLSNARTMILIVHIFMIVNKLCLSRGAGRKYHRFTTDCLSCHPH